MRKEVRAAVVGVARDLKAAEASVDSQIERAASLVASIVRNREAAGLPFADIQLAVNDATQAMRLSVESRHHLSRAHVRLRKASVDNGLATAHGDVFPWCPPADGERGEIAPLRAIA